LGVVESQRDPASVGQANEQRRAAYERGDGNGNLPCAYRLHGRSQKMNFNATTGRRFALDQGNQTNRICFSFEFAGSVRIK
jgi:hypothetical protein